MARWAPFFSRQDAKAHTIQEFPLLACFAALREISPILTPPAYGLFLSQSFMNFVHPETMKMILASDFYVMHT